ncbi:MAG: hypothetical protein JWQ79_1869 [Mucilaginibacter sp.]|nr:hypothetical protein [Mucilaginibacter sp.]
MWGLVFFSILTFINTKKNKNTLQIRKYSFLTDFINKSYSADELINNLNKLNIDLDKSCKMT